jgi:tRNA (adenine9-N1/guanine9-N1)-methyltransferase
VRLKDVLIEILKEKGIERIYTPIRMENRNPIQQIAVEVANGNAKICKAERRTTLSYDLSGNLTKAHADVFAGKCERNVLLDREGLLREAEKRFFPHIVVDCSFLNLHTQKEKSRLKVQLKATLGVVRDFMWDEKLAVSGDLPSNYVSDLSSRVLFFRRSVDFLDKTKDVILFDPHGSEVFEGERADCYIIGGIVDKSGNKKGLTGKIGEMLEKEGIGFKSMRIELRGDVVGVPDRINAITEIVLLTVLDGLEIEAAIKKVQSRLVAKWRLKKELPKISKRVDRKKAFRFVKKSDYERFGWLNVTFKDFLDACRDLGFLVLSDEISEKIERQEYDPVKKRYLM